MTRGVVRTPDICGGAPCIQGTRLQCSDVVLRLTHLSGDVTEYLQPYPYLTPEDIRSCINYCAEQLCLVDNRVTYCQRCSLDRRPAPEPPEAFLSSIEALGTLGNRGESGQVFLGTPEEYAEDIRPKDIWMLAKRLQGGA